MSKFVLEIELGNDAMQDCQQIAGALIKVAGRLIKNQYDLNEDIVRGIVDENGNSVGFWKLELDDENDVEVDKQNDMDWMDAINTEYD